MDNTAGIGNFNIPNHYQLNKMTLAMIKDKDGDWDSALSVKELNVPDDVFTKIDINGDGNADREELNAAHPLAKLYDILAHQPPPTKGSDESVDAII